MRAPSCPDPVAPRGAVCESGCLGMQPQSGGKFRPRLNTCERPIANKYREGKMKSILERKLNEPEIARRKLIADSVVRTLGDDGNIVFTYVRCRFECVWVATKDSCQCSQECVCFPVRVPQTQVQAQHPSLLRSARSRLERNVVNYPVLKHGPRSATCARVFGW